MFTQSKNTKRLTSHQVLEIRRRYFIHLDSLSILEKAFNVSVPTLKKAIHQKPPYHKITDDLPEHLKENRKPARLTYIGSKKHNKWKMQQEKAEEKRKQDERMKEHQKKMDDFMRWD